MPATKARARWRILLVDDSPTILGVLQAALANDEYQLLTARTGPEALEKVRSEAPDLVLLDIMLPQMDGVEVCRRVKSDSRTALLPVVLVTSLDSVEDKIRGIDAGADEFLTKPVNPLELKARVASLLRIRNLISQLDGAQNVIRALARAVEGKDPYTSQHTERVARYALRLGSDIGLSWDDLFYLELGAQIHDIGKIAVAESVLNKPGRLDDAEFQAIKTHPVIGADICRPLATLARVVAVVRNHHERWDGLGYPDGLKGEEIALEARIVAIADAFDAMTSDRPYRKKMSPMEAGQILRDGAGTQWDAELVYRFLALIDRGEIP